MAVDDDIAGGRTKACNLGVIPNLEGEWRGCGAVGSGLEEQRNALGAKLVGYLLRRNRINGCLNLAHRHGGIEHNHILAEGGGCGRVLRRKTERG